MTIKSKAFKFLLGIAVVLAVAVTASLANAADFGTATLRVGSRGAAVMEVQKLVGVTADGAFGPMTEAAVKVWQANAGLRADGIFGPASMAKAYELLGGSVVEVPGCPAGALFNNLTGEACGVVAVEVPGCPAGALFNNLTGEACGTTTTVSSVLKGDEADLDWSVVEEGDLALEASNQHAFTIEVEADRDGGDAKIERLDLTLLAKKNLPSPASPVNSYRAITHVALKVDGDVIAKADTGSRSDWRGSNDTIRFNNLDLVIKSGKVVEIGVYLDVTDKADTIIFDDLAYRVTDATGYVETGNLKKSSDGKSLAEVSVKEADDVTFRITENRSNPKDTNLDVSASRSNETLVIADVEVRKGEGVLEDVKVEITFDGTVSDPEIKALASRFALEVGGKQVDYVSSSSFPTVGSGKILTLTFDADEFDVEEGDKFQIEVLATTRAYDGKISSMKVTGIDLIGYDDANSKTFGGATIRPISFGPLFTLTEGDIEIYISEVEVIEQAENKGSISFKLEIENDTGDDFMLASGIDAAKVLQTPNAWNFVVKGYGVIGITSITLDTGTLYESGGTTAIVPAASTTDTDSYITDGSILTFDVVLPFDGKSSTAFSIELKDLAEKAIGYTWTR